MSRVAASSCPRVNLLLSTPAKGPAPLILMFHSLQPGLSQARSGEDPQDSGADEVTPFSGAWASPDCLQLRSWSP